MLVVPTGLIGRNTDSEVFQAFQASFDAHVHNGHSADVPGA